MERVTLTANKQEQTRQQEIPQNSSVHMKKESQKAVWTVIYASKPSLPSRQNRWDS